MKSQAIKLLSLTALIVILCQGKAFSAVDACISIPATYPYPVTNKSVYICNGSSLQLTGDNCLNNAPLTDLQFSWINLDNPTIPDFAQNIYPTEAGRWELTLTNSNDGSTDKDTLTLIYFNTPSFTINNYAKLASGCTYETITLKITTLVGSNYKWYVYDSQKNGNDTLQANVNTINILSSNIPTGNADYFVTADYNGTYSGGSYYCLLRDSISALEKSTPSVNLRSDTSVCEGTVLKLLADVIMLPDSSAGNPANLSYAWNGSSTFVDGDNIRNSSPTPGIQNYSVSVKNILGCSSTDYSTITVNPNPIVSVGAATLICPGNSIGLSAVVNGGTPGIYDFHWSPKASLNDSLLQSPTATPSATTTYSVLVKTNKGCSGTASKTINVNPAITLTPNFTDSTTCGTDQVKLIASASGGGGIFTFSWTPSAEIDSTKLIGTAETAYVNPSSPTKFTVVTTDNHNCKAQTSISLDKLSVELGGQDTIAVLGDSIKLNAFNSSQVGFSYRWKDSTGNIVGSQGNYIAKSTNKYTVEVYNPGTSCFVSDTKAVYFTNEIVQKVFVPNVFNPDLPNSDNSHLRVYGNNVSDKEFAFQIYDSWGQVVYEASTFTEAHDHGWNGKLQNSGQLLNFGVYTYKLRGQFYDGSTFQNTGTATLIK